MPLARRESAGSDAAPCSECVVPLLLLRLFNRLLGAVARIIDADGRGFLMGVCCRLYPSSVATLNSKWSQAR